MTSSTLGIWLLAESLPAAEDSGLAAQFGIDGGKFAAQIVVFLALFFLLKKFAYNPIQKILEQRREQIAQSVANADRIKLELEAAEKTRAELIKKANEQANALIEEARASAEKIGGQKIQEAIAQAENVLRKAAEASARDRERVMAEIKQEMGRLVVATTAKVIGKTLTAEDQTRLEKEALSSLS